MHLPALKRLAALALVVATSGLFASSAPAQNEPVYRYGWFKYAGARLENPSAMYCPSPTCKVRNRQLNTIYIHSPIFELPDRRKVDLWETGKEFCRRARQQMGEAWWKGKGLPDCIGGGLMTYQTEEQARDELQRLYNQAQQYNRPDHPYEVFQFADFQHKNHTFVFLRFPGAVALPVPASAAAVRPAPPPPALPASSARIAAPPPPPVSMPVTSEQAQRDQAERERLNREQAEFARNQLAQNEANRRAVEQATHEREATIARQRAEYEAALAATEAERQRREREYAAAMERWRADVEACRKGDKSRCAPQ